jgi:hypothetical protein
VILDTRKEFKSVLKLLTRTFPLGLVSVILRPLALPRI